MAFNLASLNARRLRDPRFARPVLGDLRNCCIDVAAVQETHFICEDVEVLANDYVIFSAFGQRLSAGVSLLVRGSFHADVNVVFSGEGSWLIVADVGVRSFKFSFFR